MNIWYLPTRFIINSLLSLHFGILCIGYIVYGMLLCYQNTENMKVVNLFVPIHQIAQLHGITNYKNFFCFLTHFCIIYILVYHSYIGTMLNASHIPWCRETNQLHNIIAICTASLVALYYFLQTLQLHTVSLIVNMYISLESFRNWHALTQMIFCNEALHTSM